MAAEKTGLRKWLWEQRNASRLGYVLHMGTRVLTSFLGLFWIRLLVGVMGLPLNSLFLAVQYVFSFGNLGDLGMGGVIGIRTGQHLGAGKSKEVELRNFLASARSVFLLLAFVVATAMVALSPWLPHWLGYREVIGYGPLPGIFAMVGNILGVPVGIFPKIAPSGPLPPLFAMGGLVMATVLLSSYLNNLNYACGNITWPVLPDFLLLQVSLFSHWWLARQEQPLWIQFIPYVVAAAIRLVLVFLYVRTSHPQLGTLFPLGFNRRMMLSLFEGSFWLYLCTLGNQIYRGTDSQMINAGFPLGTFAGYNYNYKFCELAVFVALTASFVTLPKITQWMASSDPKDQERVRFEMRRLNQFQTLLGCGAALTYLACNSLFMKLWFLHKDIVIEPAVLTLQLAFALNLAVTTSGDTGIQLVMRSGKRGMRVAGTVIALTGILNLVLSYVAMKMSSLVGIAMATVLAQSVLSLLASSYVCRYLSLPWAPWAVKSWLVPLLGVSLAGWLRMIWPMDSLAHVSLLLSSYAVMLAISAWALGITLAFIREELKLVRGMLKK